MNSSEDASCLVDLIRLLREEQLLESVSLLRVGAVEVHLARPGHQPAAVRLQHPVLTPLVLTEAEQRKRFLDEIKDRFPGAHVPSVER